MKTWSLSAAAIGGDAQGSAGHGLQFERVEQELLMKPLVTPTGASLGEIDVPTAGMRGTSSVVVVVSLLVVGGCRPSNVAICSTACTADPISD